MVDINKAINKFGKLNPDFSSLANVKLTRDILKLSIMTKVYNVTTYGIAVQLQKKLQILDLGPKSDRSKGIDQSIKTSSGEIVINNNLLDKTWRTSLIDESGELFNSENS